MLVLKTCYCTPLTQGSASTIGALMHWSTGCQKLFFKLELKPNVMDHCLDPRVRFRKRPFFPDVSTSVDL